MIVIFPLLVSRNVNSNIIPGLAITLEHYIASYAIGDFVGKAKEFNKYYQYKIKAGKLYQESDSNWFDLDPVTRQILGEQEDIQEGRGKKSSNRKNRAKNKKQNQNSLQNQSMLNNPNNPYNVNRSAGISAAEEYLKNKKENPTKKGRVFGPPKGEYAPTDDPTIKKPKWLTKDNVKGVLTTAQDVNKQMADWKKNKDKEKHITKPTFTNASIQAKTVHLEPTWVEVRTKDDITKKLGIKVVPMMIEGFNVKHTISTDMQKYMLNTFIAKISRKIMRLVYKMIDRWTFYGNRPRGDIRQDVFYARTGHDGQPFILLDKDEDVPKFFFSQPQNLLKLWHMSWGNLMFADESTKTVMFCMKKHKGMCSNFTYSMLHAQMKKMGEVFEDMESARKATSSLFKFNKKVSSMAKK